MQSPSLTLNRVIVGVLMSLLEWKSLNVYPCSDPLYRRVVMSLLLPRRDSKNNFYFSLVAHFDFGKNLSIIDASISGTESGGLG